MFEHTSNTRAHPGSPLYRCTRYLHICTACDAVEEGNEPSCTCWSLLTGIAESNGAQLVSATHWFPRVNVSWSTLRHFEAKHRDIFMPIVATLKPFCHISAAGNEIFGCSSNWFTSVTHPPYGRRQSMQGLGVFPL